MVLPVRMRRSISKTSVVTSPGTGVIEVRSAAPSPDTMSVSFKPARSDFRQIVIEPVGERRIDIGDLARRVDREEAARRVIEIFDRVLQLLKHVLLPLAVAGDIGNRPHRIFRLALALAERTDPHPEPAAVGAVGAGETDLFLLALAFARRLEQPEHRFRHVGIADENPLHRANVLRARGPRERQIGRIGISDMAAGIGDGDPVIGEIGDAADDGIVDRTVGKANDTGRKSKQIEQADHRKQRQQAENIRLRLRPADRGQRDRDRHDGACHQQHQQDAAAPPYRLVGGGFGRGAIMVRFGGHFKENSLSTRIGRAYVR